MAGKATSPNYNCYPSVRRTEQVAKESNLLNTTVSPSADWKLRARGSSSNDMVEHLQISRNYDRKGIIAPSDIAEKVRLLTIEAEKEITSNRVLVGICEECRAPIIDATDACEAMEKLYHSSCFICVSCGRSLRGKTFYAVGGKIFCEEDYLCYGFQQSAERCEACGHLIVDQILQAADRSYHPACFRCNLCCVCLDGVPFIVGSDALVYCVSDYHKVFAPRCAVCFKPIEPEEGRNETVRVVSMSKNFHIDCYVCEGCGIQLTDEIERRCYPFDGHLLCQTCHLHWASAVVTDL